jgi:hypothetical protein
MCMTPEIIELIATFWNEAKGWTESNSILCNCNSDERGWNAQRPMILLLYAVCIYTVWRCRFFGSSCWHNVLIKLVKLVPEECVHFVQLLCRGLTGVIPPVLFEPTEVTWWQKQRRQFFLNYYKWWIFTKAKEASGDEVAYCQVVAILLSKLKKWQIPW